MLNDTRIYFFDALFWTLKEYKNTSRKFNDIVYLDFRSLRLFMKRIDLQFYYVYKRKWYIYFLVFRKIKLKIASLCIMIDSPLESAIVVLKFMTMRII